MPAPLLIRPGARYECHGDGTCCTTIHLLGPVSRAEAQSVRIAAGIVYPSRNRPAIEWHDGIKGLVIAPDGGRCMFLDGNARCRLHARLGEHEKPAVCRHFPLGSTATDAGVRVTLSHRCPCVSIGESELLDEKRARAALASPGSGRIVPSNRAEGLVPWRARRTVDIDTYQAWEKGWLDKLDCADGPPLESLLKLPRGDRLPRLEATTWKEVGRRLAKWAADEDENDGFFCTIRWVERALAGDTNGALPRRPWSWTFDRTARRAGQTTPMRKIYGSWLADDLWSMTWAIGGTLYRAMADWGARYTIAKRIAARLERIGIRPDLAAAEAIMMVDVLGAADPWAWARRRLVEAPLGTF